MKLYLLMIILMISQALNCLGSEQEEKGDISHVYYDSTLFYFRFFASVNLDKLDRDERSRIEPNKRQAIAMAFVAHVNARKGSVPGDVKAATEYVIGLLLRGSTDKYIRNTVEGYFDSGDGGFSISDKYIKDYEKAEFQSDMGKFLALRQIC